jgi:acyl carrier protein
MTMEHPDKPDQPDQPNVPGTTDAPADTSPVDPAIAGRIVEQIIERLELEDFTVDDFPRDAVLFAPPEGGGLGFDSIASLEIIAGLADEFDLPFDNMAREDFMSVDSLARYVAREQAAEADPA